MEDIVFWWDSYWFGFQRYQAFFAFILIFIVFAISSLVALFRHKSISRMSILSILCVAAIPLITIGKEAEFRIVCANHSGHIVYDEISLRQTDWSKFMYPRESIPERDQYPFRALGLFMNYREFLESYSMEITTFEIDDVAGLNQQLIRKSDGVMLAETKNFYGETPVFLSQVSRRCSDINGFDEENYPFGIDEFLSPYVRASTVENKL